MRLTNLIRSFVFSNRDSGNWYLSPGVWGNADYMAFLSCQHPGQHCGYAIHHTLKITATGISPDSHISEQLIPKVATLLPGHRSSNCLLVWTREYDVREHTPHTWPSSNDNYLKSIFLTVTYSAAICRLTSSWSSVSQIVAEQLHLNDTTSGRLPFTGTSRSYQPVRKCNVSALPNRELFLTKLTLLFRDDHCFAMRSSLSWAVLTRYSCKQADPTGQFYQIVNAQDVEDVLLKATNAISRLGRVIPPELRLVFFSYVKHLRMTNVRVRYKTKIVNLGE